jgi:ferredoxin
MYHVEVNASRCQGHARCLALAPDIFDFDDEGYAHVPADQAEQAELTDALRLARSNCPERAIVLTPDPPR